MTLAEAQRISSYILDGQAGLDGRVIPLGNGHEFAVVVYTPAEWFCWTFADWNAFYKKHRQRRYTKRWRARAAATP